MQTEKVGPERCLGPLLEERAVARDEPLSPLPPNFAQNSPDLGVWTTRVALLIIRLAKAPDLHICGGSHFGFASRGGSAMVKNPVPPVGERTTFSPPPKLCSKFSRSGPRGNACRFAKPPGFCVCGCAGIWRTRLEGSFPLGHVSCELSSSEQVGLEGSCVVEPVSCELASSEQAGLEGPFAVEPASLRAASRRAWRGLVLWSL